MKFYQDDSMARKTRIQTMIRLLLKISLASALIYWLISTGKLNFNELDILWRNPDILAFNLTFWVGGAAILCSLRWRALVRGMGFTLSVFQSVRLNLIGLFFNTVMPGMVGGDVVKALYVCKGQPGQARVPVLLTILLDRVLGLLALFCISFVAILINFSTIYENPLMRPFILMTFSVICGISTLVFMAALSSETRDKVFFLRWLFAKIDQIRILKKIYDALRSYKDNPVFLVQAFGIAIVHQMLLVGLYFTVSRVLIDAQLPLGILMTILPIGVVTTAVPLTPGGLGVGHVAFDKLFQVAGLGPGGANIFNVVFFGQLFLNLLGFIPYLFLRNELAPLMDSEKAAAESQSTI